MDTRLKIAGIAVLVLGSVGALSQAVASSTTHVPAYVLRVPLPPVGGAIGLPVIEGPPDASRPLVVIDAGHGGHDPGASGAGGLREKDVTLALALAVRDAIVREGRMRVALTRSEDKFLVLEERAGIARRMGADLFVSIHADAADNAGASGGTVYTLSDKSSDAVAQGLAARENRADTLNGVSLGGKSDAVSSILVDLSRREAAVNSQKFSDLILREDDGKIRFHATPQRQAGFVVLKSLDMPSVLFEAGYISNADDARALTDDAWRRDFAEGLSRAIEVFLARQTQAQ